MGGFELTAPPAVYKRWCAFGLLSSHSRLHGAQSYRVPWLFDDESVEVLRHFSQLKCRLMPYLYAAAAEAHTHGTPVLRPMLLEYPDDPASDTLDRQYMLGGAVLVAPVLSFDGVVDCYLPAGRWTHFLSGKVVEGGRWVREQYDFLSLPLFVRPNSAIVVGDNDLRPDYDYADGFTLHIYELEPGAVATAVIPAADGSALVSFTVTRQTGVAPDQIRVHWQGTPRNWRVLLAGAAAGASIIGGTGEYVDGGLQVTPAAAVADLFISLQS